jgi:hypothetical protein
MSFSGFLTAATNSLFYLRKDGHAMKIQKCKGMLNAHAIALSSLITHDLHAEFLLSLKTH